MRHGAVPTIAILGYAMAVKSLRGIHHSVMMAH
jgi:hypothetical protein